MKTENMLMADTTHNKIIDLQNETKTLTQALSGRVDIAHERIIRW